MYIFYLPRLIKNRVMGGNNSPVEQYREGIGPGGHAKHERGGIRSWWVSTHISSERGSGKIMVEVEMREGGRKRPLSLVSSKGGVKVGANRARR